MLRLLQKIHKFEKLLVKIAFPISKNEGLQKIRSEREK